MIAWHNLPTRLADFTKAWHRCGEREFLSHGSKFGPISDLRENRLRSRPSGTIPASILLQQTSRAASPGPLPIPPILPPNPSTRASSFPRLLASFFRHATPPPAQFLMTSMPCGPVEVPEVPVSKEEDNPGPGRAGAEVRLWSIVEVLFKWVHGLYLRFAFPLRGVGAEDAGARTHKEYEGDGVVRGGMEIHC